MLLTKEGFQKGQVVACKHSGNKARYSEDYTLGKVVAVSKKYITVSFNENGTNGFKFILEESFERDYLLQKSNTVGNYELFPSEQAYLEYEEKKNKIAEIESAFPRFGDSKLTVDQVRRIHDIIKE
jgi:hypothetical protein